MTDRTPRLKDRRPPCEAAGAILCRGCPGWHAMTRPTKDRRPAWAVVHCSAVGLTVTHGERGTDNEP